MTLPGGKEPQRSNSKKKWEASIPEAGLPSAVVWKRQVIVFPITGMHNMCLEFYNLKALNTTLKPSNWKYPQTETELFSLIF